MLFPATSVQMIDVWHVIGLRGTGSDSYSVTDLFVPQDHSVARDDPSERRQPGPLYCFPTGSLFAAGFAGVALGIARTTFDAFVRLASAKTPRGASGALRENRALGLRVARDEQSLVH